MEGIKYYVPGIVLILAALLIVAVPEILVAFIASMIILAGIVALYIGHGMRKSAILWHDREADLSEDDLSGHWCYRSPLFRRFLGNRW